MVFETWKQLMSGLKELTEEQLVFAINYEASVYKRRAFIERMHMRYTKLRAAREREQLIKGEIVL